MEFACRSVLALHLLLLLALSPTQAGPSAHGPVEGQSEPNGDQNYQECFRLADAIHNYVKYADSQTRYYNITQEIEWSTSINILDVNHLRFLACRILDKSAAQVARFAEESGIASFMARRGYGYGMMVYRMYREGIEQGSSENPWLRVAVNAVEALDKKGFMCLENSAMNEVVEHWTRMGAPVGSIFGVGCGDFVQLAQDILSLLPQQTILEVDTISGLNLADTSNIGQILCDVAECSTFEAIIRVLNQYGLLERGIAYAFRNLPNVLTPYSGPISQMELASQLTDDDELVAYFTHLQSASPAEIEAFRTNARLAVILHRQLKKLSDGMVLADN